MSKLIVADLTQRALERIGRRHLVDALAPFPERPALDLWQFTRRTFVHGAADLAAGFALGGDSNLLRRLKLGLADEGVDQAVIDALTEADALTATRGARAPADALARLPATVRDIITATKPPPKYQNWFFEKRRTDTARRELTDLELAATWEDSGAALVEQLSLDLSGVGSRDLTRQIPAPLRITQVTVSGDTNQDAAGVSGYSWSVNPPGLGEAQSVRSAVAVLSPLFDGTGLRVDCDVPVTSGAVIMRATANNSSATERIAFLITVSYKRLVRKRS